MGDTEGRAPRLEIFPDLEGDYRWRLLAGNGETVLPPEGHRDVTDAHRALTRAAELLALAILGPVDVLDSDGTLAYTVEGARLAHHEDPPDVD